MDAKGILDQAEHATMEILRKGYPLESGTQRNQREKLIIGAFGGLMEAVAYVEMLGKEDRLFVGQALSQAMKNSWREMYISLSPVERPSEKTQGDTGNMTELSGESKRLVEQMRMNVIQAFRDAHPGDSEDMHQERERGFAEFMDNAARTVELMNGMSEQDKAIMAKSMGMTVLNEFMGTLVMDMETPITGSLGPTGFIPDGPKDK